MEKFRFRLPASQAKSIHLYKNISIMDLFIFRQGLMMIPSVSKYVAQGQ